MASPPTQAFGAVTPPIVLSSTYSFAGFEQPRAHDYSRAANPTRELLADTIAKLEGGAGAVVVSSGMAAVDLTLSQLGRDDLVIAPHDCYGGTYRLLAARRDRGQFNVAFIDQNDEDALDAALRRRPSLVLIETPSNPLDARRRYPRCRGAGACGRRESRRRQHLPFARAATADRAWRRLRDPLDHQISQWPFRCRRRRRRRGGQGGCRKPCRLGQCHRRDRLALRFLSDAAGIAHPVSAPAATASQRGRHRRAFSMGIPR